MIPVELKPMILPPLPHFQIKITINCLFQLLSMLDIFQQFTFVIKQKEQYTDLTISNNTHRSDRQKQ